MFSPELKQEHIRRRELWDSLTPEQRYAAGMQVHKPRRKGGGAATANLEGDLPTNRRGKRPSLPQTPERQRKNAYAREYQRKKRLRQG